MMSISAGASYTDLPLELREEILCCCTRRAIASLCLTAKCVSQEAEAVLYDTITLHRSRGHEFACCLRTLNDPTCKKAELVQTFAVTLTEDHGDAEDLQCAVEVLLRMKSLKVLSIWAPEEISTRDVQVAIRSPSKSFVLRKLYISGLETSELPQILEGHPNLQVLGLWSNADNGMETESEAMARLRYPLAVRRLTQSVPTTSVEQDGVPGSPSQVQFALRPVIFGIERRGHYIIDLTLRTLTIFDYPLPSSQSRATTDLLVFSAKTLEARYQLYRDLALDFSQDDEHDVTNGLQLVVRDLSPRSLEWAEMVALPILSMAMSSYGEEGPIIGGPFVSIMAIEPPKRPFNLAHLHGPFKRLVSKLLDLHVDELFVQNYFDNDPESGSAWPRMGHFVSEEESLELFKVFEPLVREVMAARGAKRPLAFQIFEGDVNTLV